MWHFAVHLGLHYTGRQRRFSKRSSCSVALTDKTLWTSAQPLRLFGPALQRLLDRRYRASFSVVLSDGDEGLERLREAHFSESLWL